MLELDRITNPLRLAQGSHEAGSGKGCAMNVISYTNGDTEITDYPKCSARPLARLVQMVNDTLADSDTGYLSPENALIALDLGWRTVGTADASLRAENLWLVELLVSPEWGVVRYASDNGAAAIRRVAELRQRRADGEAVNFGTFEYAYSAAFLTSMRAPALDAAYHAANAAATAAVGAVVYHAASAVAAANPGNTTAVIEFVRTAIEAWRRIAELDEPAVDYAVINTALEELHA